jgi:glycolate oxidase iron-sulfur subunit
VSELLAPDRLPGPAIAGTEGAEASTVRIAYDAPCHLLHAQGIRDAPLDALAAAGVHAERLPSWERCCGGAGLYNLLEPALSAEVARPKLDEIEAGRFHLLATGNPGCAMFLGARLRRAGSETVAVHPAELVDAAERDTEEERTTEWS